MVSAIPVFSVFSEITGIVGSGARQLRAVTKGIGELAHTHRVTLGRIFGVWPSCNLLRRHIQFLYQTMCRFNWTCMECPRILRPLLHRHHPNAARLGRMKKHKRLETT